MISIVHTTYTIIYISKSQLLSVCLSVVKTALYCNVESNSATLYSFWIVADVTLQNTPVHLLLHNRTRLIHTFLKCRIYFSLQIIQW